MKIEQEIVEFQPVVLTLESVAEVRALLEAVDRRIEVIDGNEEFRAEEVMLIEISNFLADAK